MQQCKNSQKSLDYDQINSISKYTQLKLKNIGFDKTKQNLNFNKFRQ